MPYSDLQLASVFIQTGELDDALEALNRHLAATPLDGDALRLRAEIMMRRLDPDSLAAALTDLDAITRPLPDDYLKRATVMLRMDQTAEALDTLDDAHRHFPDNGRVLERLLQLLRDAGRLSQARRLVAQQAQSDWRWRSWAGELAAAENDLNAAIGHVSAAIEQLRTQYGLQSEGPAHLDHMMQMAVVGAFARLHLNRGNAYQQIGHWQAATHDYALAARMLPGDASITLKRGIIAWMDNNQQLATALCQDAFANASENVRAILLALLDDYPDLREHLSL
jgi:tetratricopeptide (TPR) repeat protein